MPIKKAGRRTKAAVGVEDRQCIVRSSSWLAASGQKFVHRGDLLARSGGPSRAAESQGLGR
jgi:hypothetical protein